MRPPDTPRCPGERRTRQTNRQSASANPDPAHQRPMPSDERRFIGLRTSQPGPVPSGSQSTAAERAPPAHEVAVTGNHARDHCRCAEERSDHRPSTGRHRRNADSGPRTPVWVAPPRQRMPPPVTINSSAATTKTNQRPPARAPTMGTTRFWIGIEIMSHCPPQPQRHWPIDIGRIAVRPFGSAPGSPSGRSEPVLTPIATAGKRVIKPSG